MHANEKIVRARILCRRQTRAVHKLVRPSATSAAAIPRPFEGYKSKELIQQSNRGGTSGRRQRQQHRRRLQIRVAPTKRLHRQTLGNAAGIRKQLFDFEYYDDNDDADGDDGGTTTVTNNSAYKIGRQRKSPAKDDDRLAVKRLKLSDDYDGASMSDDPPNFACNAPASSYSDYSGSPVIFNSAATDEALLMDGGGDDDNDDGNEVFDRQISTPTISSMTDQLPAATASAPPPSPPSATEPALIFPKSEPGLVANSTNTAATMNTAPSPDVLYSDLEWLNIFSIDCLQSSASDREEETKTAIITNSAVENAITLKNELSTVMPPAGDIDCVIIHVTTARQRNRANRLKIVNLPITIVNRCIPSYDLLHDMQPFDMLRMKDALERYEYQPDKPFRVRID